MNQLSSSVGSILAVATSFLLPQLSNAADYSSDGAILLGSEAEKYTNNIVAALVGANFSLACLAIVVLQLISIYIFHQIWHPRRVHEEMSEKEKRRGSRDFFAGGTIVWMTISIMAENWCTILPLAIFLLGLFVWYVTTTFLADIQED